MSLGKREKERDRLTNTRTDIHRRNTEVRESESREREKLQSVIETVDVRTQGSTVSYL